MGHGRFVQPAVSSAGYWPGPDDEGVFTSMPTPSLPGIGARLPHRPLQSTYDVAADTGNWDRAALERGQ